MFSLKTYRTNDYASDSLCENRQDLNVCKEDYDTSKISREEFERIIAESENSEDSSIDGDKNNNENNLLKLIIDNYIYIVGGIIAVVVIVIVISILRHRKRGVLE